MTARGRTRILGGVTWVCDTPGLRWNNDFGGYLYFTDGEWWLMQSGSERSAGTKFTAAATWAGEIITGRRES